MALVYVNNKKNGTTYVYESKNYWNKEKKQSRSTRICIGKLDGAGNLIQSKRFDESGQILPLKRGPVPVIQIKHSFYGATYLFNALGDKLEVTKDLKTCFPDMFFARTKSPKLQRKIPRHPVGNYIELKLHERMLPSVTISIKK